MTCAAFLAPTGPRPAGPGPAAVRGRALVFGVQAWFEVLGIWASDASGTASVAFADTIAAAGVVRQ